MTQRRKPEKGSIEEARVPHAGDGTPKASFGTTVRNDLTDNYFIDYRPFGGSFYGRFWDNDMNYTSGQYVASATATSIDYWLNWSYTYYGDKTSPIDSTFTATTETGGGWLAATDNEMSLDVRVSGYREGGTDIYLGVRFSAANDPKPYPITAYARFSDDSFNTYYRYYSVTSFPTTFGYTLGGLSSEDDQADATVTFYGPTVGDAYDEVLPLLADTVSATGILQTPDGSPIVPGGTSNDTFSFYTRDASVNFCYFTTTYNNRRVRDATPLTDAGSPILTGVST